MKVNYLVTCDECKGTGKEDFIISCCGDDITNNDIDLCPTCFEHQGMEFEDCLQCNGTGKTTKKNDK